MSTGGSRFAINWYQIWRLRRLTLNVVLSGFRRRAFFKRIFATFYSFFIQLIFLGIRDLGLSLVDLFHDLVYFQLLSIGPASSLSCIDPLVR